MAIAFDAASTASKSSGAGTTVSWNHTVSTNVNSILIVATGIRTTASSLINTTAVTYAGQALTRATFARNETATSAVSRVELWYLLNPPAGVSSIHVTFANSTFSVPAGQLAVSYTGTSAIGNVANSTGASSNPSQALTLTAAGSWLVCAVKTAVTAAQTTVSGETIRAVTTEGTDAGGIGDASPGSSGSNTYNWTGGLTTLWAIAALELIPSAPIARKAKASWAQVAAPDVKRRATVSWAQVAAPDAPRRATVSWAQVAAPDVPRQAKVSWGELAAPDVPRQAKVSWAELSAPDAGVVTRQAKISWAELSAPDVPRQAKVSWGELAAPDVPRQVKISWAELAAPDAPRRAKVSWGELATPDVKRRAKVSWGELAAPDAPRQAKVSWAELSAPDVGVVTRQAKVSWAELSAPDAPRQAKVSWAELAAPDVQRQAKVSWAELAAPDVQRNAKVSWAELAAPDTPRQAKVSWAELSAPDEQGVVTRRAYISWAELRTPNAIRLRVGHPSGPPQPAGAVVIRSVKKEKKFVDEAKRKHDEEMELLRKQREEAEAFRVKMLATQKRKEMRDQEQGGIKQTIQVDTEFGKLEVKVQRPRENPYALEEKWARRAEQEQFQLAQQRKQQEADDKKALDNKIKMAKLRAKKGKKKKR